MKFQNKILVVYLANFKEKPKTLRRFVKYYKKYKPNKNHELLICFKNFSNSAKDLTSWKKILNKIKYKFFLDKELIDDYDWGSYRRVAKKYKKKYILFLNSHSFPNKKKWLDIFIKYKSYKNIVGNTSSYGSLSSSFLQFKFKINFIRSIIYGISNIFRFPFFPNPHIRSNAFMMRGDIFLSLKLPKKFRHKTQTNTAESGWNGMSRQLKKRNFNLIVINSDGNSFQKDNWKTSKTFAYKNQNKLLISDNRTRDYKNSNAENKKFLENIHWGI